MISKSIKNIVYENDYQIFHLKSTLSTMLDVKNYLEKNNKNCIFLSDVQTNGRGRRGNKWESPIGNLYCSISFDNFLKAENHYIYSMLMSVTIKQSLNKFDIKDINFKWPNDLVFNKKKFGGMILENYYVNTSKYILAGLGINIKSSPKIKNYPTTHLNSIDKIININNFIKVFFEILFFNLNNLKKRNYKIINLFEKSLLFYNEPIELVISNKEVVSGVFRGINKDGSLKLEINKQIKNYYNGSIKL